MTRILNQDPYASKSRMGILNKNHQKKLNTEKFTYYVTIRVGYPAWYHI